MPRLRPPQALDQLAEWINASTDEVCIDGLLQQHGNHIPRRTLQRHLALLVEQKRIGVRGEGRATPYHRLLQPGASAQTSTAVATAVPPSTADYAPPPQRAQTSVPLSPSPATYVNRRATNWTFCRATSPTIRPTCRRACVSNCTPWAAHWRTKPLRALLPKTSSAACSSTCLGPRPTSKVTPTADSPRRWPPKSLIRSSKPSF